MLHPELVREIRRLLAEDQLSQWKIAEVLGVSRTTVHLIAAGKRRDCQLRVHDEEPETEPPPGPPQRCHGCGGMVLPPCRLCQVRAQVAENRKRSDRHSERLAG